MAVVHKTKLPTVRTEPTKAVTSLSAVYIEPIRLITSSWSAHQAYMVSQDYYKAVSHLTT